MLRLCTYTYLCVILVHYIFQRTPCDLITSISFAGLFSGGIGERSLRRFGPSEDDEGAGKDPNVIFESHTYTPELEAAKDLSIKVIQLRNNIEVILNSNPRVYRTEISVINQVGSMHDPVDLQGLGFYLMNVMVSGSKRNPSQGLLDFVKENSLFLDYELYLTYSEFEVKTTKNLFEKTLDLISEMFKSPVITEEVMESALKHMESFSPCMTFMNYLALSDPKCVLDRHKYGNTHTMKTIPESNNIDMKERLTDLFEKQFSSNRIVLSIRSDVSIEVMKILVIKYFSDIPDKNLSLVNVYKPLDDTQINPLSHSIGKVLYNIEEKSKTLMLLFPLNNFILSHLRHDPLFFIRRSICEDKKGSLFKYLNEKHLANSLECNIFNHSHGFTNIHIVFHLTDFGIVNIHIIVRSFFYAISKIREFKPDLNYYTNKKQEKLNSIQSSIKYFDNLSSYSLLRNYFRYKCDDFVSLLFGLNEVSEFDVNLHKRVLHEINPSNLIIILNFDDGHMDTSENPQEFSGFDESIRNKDCLSYERFMNEQKSFRYITLTNLLSSEFVGVEKSKYTHKYILEEQNVCLKQYFSSFTEYMYTKISITNPKAKFSDSSTSSDIYSRIKKINFPIKLKDINDLNSPEVSQNFPFFNELYYFIPHASRTFKIYLAVNFSFPFQNEKLANIKSARIMTILLLLIEILQSYNEKIMASYRKSKVEFTPSVKMVNDSVDNLFGLSFIMASIPKAFNDFITNFTVNMRNYISLDQLTFQTFVEFYKKKLSSFIDIMPSSQLYLDFVNQINLNQDLSVVALLEELHTLTVDEFRMVLREIFDRKNISGVIYGNLTPKGAVKYLNRFFSGLFGDSPFDPSSDSKHAHKSKSRFMSRSISRSKLVRKFTSIRSNKPTKSVVLTKKKSMFVFSKKIFTTKKRTVKEKESDLDGDIQEEISSRNELYESSSSKLPTYVSTVCKDLKVLDMSSIRSNSRFFIHRKSESITHDISIIWIYIDKVTPDSLALVEFLNFAVSEYLKTCKNLNNGIEIMVKDYKISSRSCFISIEGLSSGNNLEEMNQLLVEYAERLFSPNSPILEEKLFSRSKEHFSHVYKTGGIIKDASILNIFDEISNKRFDFTKFRSTSKLLSKLTLEMLTSNFELMRKKKYMIMLTISRKGSNTVIPKEFINIQEAKDIFKQTGIRVFMPGDSMASRQSPNPKAARKTIW